MTPSLRTDISDPLWVPLLTHYTPEGTVDAARVLAHLRSLHPHVSQIMLAGSTGDGWELADDAFDALVDFAAREDLPAGTRILFGVLRGSTEDVIARLRHLEGRVAAGGLLAERFCGVAICPPIDAEADQDSILAHFDAAFAASECPVAVYQLPQVTGCRIAPETMAKLAANSRVTMFKDSSGEDTVANDRPGYDGVVMVRGAEGGYLEALAPEGSYNGWLLSTGNALGAPLREVLRLREEGKRDEAAHLSGMVSEAVAALFSAAASETGANAFSNANRAMDHLRAYGRGWRDAPATLKVDGNPLSSGLIAEAEKHAGDLLELSESGYMQAGMR